MTFVSAWRSWERSTRNVFVMAIVDTLLALGYIFSVPGLKLVWETLQSYLPNLYEPIFLQFIAMARDLSPGSRVVGGFTLSLSTEFLTLLTIHCVVAYGLGFLFQKTKDSPNWGAVNYCVLIVLLATLHLVLILRTAFLF